MEELTLNEEEKTEDLSQKKVLWILIAAGIFLLTVVGAALLLYSPSTSKKSTTHISSNLNSNVNKASVVEENLTPVSTEDTQNPYLENPQLEAENEEQVTQITVDTQVDTPKDITTQDLTVYANNTNIYSNQAAVIDLNTLKSNEDNVAKKEVETFENSKNTVYQSPIIKDDSSRSADTNIARIKQESSKNIITTPIKKIVPAPTKKPTAQPKMPDSFWVQAASFTTKKGADHAREVLMQSNIQADVFTYQDAKQLYYRVRVGPFTTKSEADYWMTKITLIDEFSSNNCYVTNSSKKR